MGTQRKIIHVDMDAFFASVEQRDFPEYRGKPLIVGGQPDKRGVVATCSYEARQFGIRSAMASSKAYRLCPQAIIVKPRFEAYKEASEIIRSIFYEYTDLVEPLSLDEAFLDVSQNKDFEGSATLIAKDIRQSIFKKTRLTASAGISYNKFLAKIASDINKPDGMSVIRPDQGEAFVETLPVGKFFGVGKATEAKMRSLGLNTGADLKALSMVQLQQYFGKSGAYYFDICRGVDDRDVVPHRERKSLGSETTFEADLCDVDEMLKALGLLAIEVNEALQIKQLTGHTLTLKVKYDNFEQITRSKTVQRYFANVNDMLPVIAELLTKTDVNQRKVRLLGITVSNFSENDTEENWIMRQMDLFKTENKPET